MFVLKKTYDAKVVEARLATVSRDDWKASSRHWEAKFKKAVTDLAAAREEIAHFDACEVRLEADRNHWREQALRDEKPAQKWRAYLKRSRDRKAAKKEGGK